MGKRQGTGALQNADAKSGDNRKARSVLDCGGPPPLSKRQGTGALKTLARNLVTTEKREASWTAAVLRRFQSARRLAH